jgi:hypothetical protein
MKKLFLIVLVILMVAPLALGLVSASGGTNTDSANWLSGWTYRKPHVINGSTAGPQTNYQIMVNVHFDYGNDTEGDVYLNQKCRPDFGDIRFTDSSGTNLLGYCIQQKIDSVRASFWVKIPYIPQSPYSTTIYIYYGNSNASTTSNKQWVFDFITDFEDNTTEGWLFTRLGVPEYISSNAFEGNYSLTASVTYGSGDYYEWHRNILFLSAGSYCMESAVCFTGEPGSEIDFIVNGQTVAATENPSTNWQWLSGSFTLNTTGAVELIVKFHLSFSLFWGGTTTEGYYIDDILMRHWCSPEPANGAWGAEQTFSNSILPIINFVEWTPTCPYPYVLSFVPIQGEPVLVEANVTEETGGSGLASVELLYRVAGGWENMSMMLNATTQLWTGTMPGQPGNSTDEFVIKAYDNAGNTAASSAYFFNVKALIPGDINGDGVVNGQDLHILAQHWLTQTP